MLINKIREEKVGLALIFFGLLLSIFTAILFGVAEDIFKNHAATIGQLQGFEGAKAKEEASKTWRYAQRTHFHSGAIASYSLVLFLFIVNLDLSAKFRRIATISLGIHNIYGLYWLNSFILAPSLGRKAARAHWLSETIVYASMLGLLVCLIIVLSNIFLNKFKEA